MYQFKSMVFSFYCWISTKKIILLFSENKMRTIHRLRHNTHTCMHACYSIGVIRQLSDLDLWTFSIVFRIYFSFNFRHETISTDSIFVFLLLTSQWWYLFPSTLHLNTISIIYSSQHFVSFLFTLNIKIWDFHCHGIHRINSSILIWSRNYNIMDWSPFPTDNCDDGGKFFIILFQLNSKCIFENDVTCKSYKCSNSNKQLIRWYSSQ